MELAEALVELVESVESVESVEKGTTKPQVVWKIQ